MDLDEHHAPEPEPRPSAERPAPTPAVASRPSGGRTLELPLPPPPTTGAARLTPTQAAMIDGLTLDPPPAFSGDAMLEHLAGPSTPAAPQRPALRATLKEYREVLVTVGLAALAVVVALGYAQGWFSGDPAPTPTRPPLAGEVPGPAAVPAETPAPSPTPETTFAAAPPGASPEPAATPAPTAPTRAAMPILSVLSEPSGAEVLVNDEVVGKTPLVLPAPKTDALFVRLRLDGYVEWNARVEPNAAGHYTTTVQLKKR